MPASVAAAVLDSVGLLSPAPAAPAPVPPVLSWPVAVSTLVEGMVTAGAAGWAQTAAPHARVAVFAGPEVTVRQLGAAVQPWLAAITNPSHPVPAADDVARAILAYNGGDLGVDSLVTSSAAVPQFVTDLTVWATLAATDAGVDLTLLATPAADVHATVGMLPQKSVGMRRDWVPAGLATLSPNWRYGTVLVDRKATRIPVAADVHGTWSWHRRDDAGNWVTDTIVNANQTAIIPDDRVAVQFGWISLQSDESI